MKHRISIFILFLLIPFSGFAQQSAEAVSEAMRIVAIADAFVQAGNADKALSLYSEACDVSVTSDEKWVTASRMSDLYVKLGNNRLALDCYDDILDDQIVLTDSTVMANMYGRMGQIYYKMHDYVKSMKCYERVKEYMKGSYDRRGKANLSVNIARTLIIAGDVVEAGKILERTEKTCIAENYDDVILELYDVKASMYSVLDDYKNAYDYKCRQNDLGHKIHERDIRATLNAKSPWNYYQKAELNVNNEKRIRQLELELEHAETQAQGFTILAYVSLAVCVVLLILAVRYYVKYRNRNQHVRLINTANDEKSRIMSVIAHDFISPFNALIGFAELQMQYAKAQDNAELLDYSRTIYQSAQTLFQMVGNIIAWSQLDIQIKPQRKPVNISVEVEGVVSLYRQMTEEKGVHVNVSIEDDVYAYVDESHFNIILRNVILNALKYTPKGGRIGVSALAHDGKASIVINDTGVGMNKSMVQKINSHQSVESTLGTNKEKGSGLGVAICADLVRINDGYLDVASVEGEGTTVTIVFETVG